MLYIQNWQRKNNVKKDTKIRFLKNKSFSMRRMKNLQDNEVLKLRLKRM